MKTSEFKDILYEKDEETGIVTLTLNSPKRKNAFGGTQGIEVRWAADIFKKDDEELARFRNTSIGFVFQFHHLLPEFSALENVAMPALIRNRPLDQVQGRAAELLTLLGLKERMHHRPGQMSGGEKQRVAVARALMNKPGLVLADEPTGNLDIQTAETLHDELIRLSRTFQQTFVIVTHNPAFAKMADRVLTIEQGQIQEYA